MPLLKFKPLKMSTHSYKGLITKAGVLATKLTSSCTYEKDFHIFKRQRSTISYFIRFQTLDQVVMSLNPGTGYRMDKFNIFLFVV